MVKQVLWSVAVCALVLLMSGVSAWAQATAQLAGTVRDESGAVLPGVTVTVTQTDTGFTRTVVTDGTGAYVMPNLPTGPYQLEVVLQGFSPYVQTGIVLQVGGSPTINAVLGLGTLQETVTVEAAAPLVDVRSAGIGEVIDQERILELPLQGRQVTDLIVLAGAAVEVSGRGPRDSANAVGVSVAGGQRYGVAYTLDGAMHTDTYNNYNLPFPFPDALQEFRVATSGLSANNGMHAGASVSAVTKSGTNRFSGNLFEFLRDKQFNASPHFAPLGPDGKQVDDGLNRNQYGGTLGGPIVENKFFFFAGYQGTRTRIKTPDNLATVPTDAMLAGDFTAFASPACNRGQQIRLRAPFVNNRIDPALFSPAAVLVANHEGLPSTSDPCGEIRFRVPLDNDESQVVTRLDYQLSDSQSLFGRYIGTFESRKPNFSQTGNLLTVRHAFSPNRTHRAQTIAFGDTLVIGTNAVNAFRVTWNRSRNRTNDPADEFFDARDLGVNLHSYVPGVINIGVSNGFTISGGSAVKLVVDNQAFQVGNDLTLVRGSHQLAMGGSVARWKSDIADYARGVGNFSFNGRRTGLGLADFLTGQVSRFRHSGPGVHVMEQTYLGLYAQDTWRASDRVTVNSGLRWEPFFGQHVRNGAITNFNLENFRQGIGSTVYTNAPAGLLWPGDPGFAPGKSGMDKQWWNFSPRLGIAWDASGDGRLAVRSSYGLAYDFPTAQLLYIFASAAPFGDRIEFPNVPFEDPYRDYGGGTQHPLPAEPPSTAAFPVGGSYGTMDPGINSTRVQSWNVTVERQLATNWQAAATYLGSYTDRLWGQVHLNPGVFLGTDSCTINGVFNRVCTTNGNIEQRRLLTLEDPVPGRGLANVSKYADVGVQDFHGMKLSVRRRAASGMNLNGNYAWSYCEADTTPSGQFTQNNAGYSDPENPSFDRGNCSTTRRHIVNLTAGAQTPQFGGVLGAIASDWRASGIFSTRSGRWLSATTRSDRSGTGISGQRIDQVNANPYGDKNDLDNYLDRAAFAEPELGTLGDHIAGSIKGPGFWNFDLAVSRLVNFAATQTLELRVEVFNVFNHFNWGNPRTTFDSRFGRITTQAGNSRIMQFGVKFGF